jgi:hypothetical protein
MAGGQTWYCLPVEVLSMVAQCMTVDTGLMALARVNREMYTVVRRDPRWSLLYYVRSWVGDKAVDRLLELMRDSGLLFWGQDVGMFMLARERAVSVAPCGNILVPGADVEVAERVVSFFCEQGYVLQCPVEREDAGAGRGLDWCLVRQGCGTLSPQRMGESLQRAGRVLRVRWGGLAIEVSGRCCGPLRAAFLTYSYAVLLFPTSALQCLSAIREVGFSYMCANEGKEWLCTLYVPFLGVQDSGIEVVSDRLLDGESIWSWWFGVEGACVRKSYGVSEQGYKVEWSPFCGEAWAVVG